MDIRCGMTTLNWIGKVRGRGEVFTQTVCLTSLGMRLYFTWSHCVCRAFCNVALSTGLLRAATREDILKFKCMHAEQMMHKCKEFSAKVSQSVHQL